MSFLRNKNFSFTAVNISITDEDLIVNLDDGRKISVPLYYFPKLENAGKEKLSKYELICRGTGIRWPEIDEDISVSGLLGLPD